MNELFKIKDLGELKYFLGLEVAKSKQGIHPWQKKFMLYLLAESRFFKCKPASTPIKEDCRLIKEGTLLLENTPNIKLIGELLYLTIITPDIAYSVQ